MEKSRIKDTDVKRYLALSRIGKEVKAEIEVLEKGFLGIVPADGFRLVGPYQVCHKTAQRKVIKWKDECLRALGEAGVNIITDDAPLGAISHSIKVNVRRDMVDELRIKSNIPEHIPDEQVGDYIITKNQKGV